MPQLGSSQAHLGPTPGKRRTATVQALQDGMPGQLLALQTAALERAFAGEL
jgi:hypothetical protein